MLNFGLLPTDPTSHARRGTLAAPTYGPVRNADLHARGHLRRCQSA